VLIILLFVSCLVLLYSIISQMSTNQIHNKQYRTAAREQPLSKSNKIWYPVLLVSADRTENVTWLLLLRGD
jgi:hypothetical protein